ncbi:MAG: HNH endonuclease signature motif containing protein [Mycobacterium sp.]
MPAVEVDHLKPRFEGGALYDFANLQSLCREHHQIKSIAERRREQAAAKAKRMRGSA